MSTIRVATYNVGDGPDSTKVKHLVSLAGRYGVSVVGCQEASDRRRALRTFCRASGWRRYQPLVSGGGAVPILWDDAVWEFVSHRSVLAVKRRWVGPRGAGPSTIKPKRINAVVLRHRESKRLLHVLNTHTLPSASRPGLPAEERANRLRHYRDHMTALVGLLDQITGRIIVTGDLNAEPDFDLLRPLRAQGLTGWTQVPTHGHKTYDYVLARNLLLLDERAVDGGSDHRTLVHTYR